MHSFSSLTLPVHCLLACLSFFLIASHSVRADNQCLSASPSTELIMAGNLESDASITPSAAIPAVTAPGVTPLSSTTYAQLDALAAFVANAPVFDSLGAPHTVYFYFFHTAAYTFILRAYVNSDEVDIGVNPSQGLPRQIGYVTMTFNEGGQRTNPPVPGVPDFTAVIPWNNGAVASHVHMRFADFAVSSSSCSISSVDTDGHTAQSNPAWTPPTGWIHQNKLIIISGNIDPSFDLVPAASIPAVTAPGMTPASTTTYSSLENLSAFDADLQVLDTGGETQSIRVIFFHTAPNQYTARGYVNSEQVAPVSQAGLPRLIFSVTMNFAGEGSRTNNPAPQGRDASAAIPWNSGRSPDVFDFWFNFTQLSGSSQSSSQICSTLIDYCPADADKTEPGLTGCGHLEPGAPTPTHTVTPVATNTPIVPTATAPVPATSTPAGASPSASPTAAPTLTTEPTPKTGTISGVVNLPGGTPLPGAFIYARCFGTTLTRSDGAYSFKGIPSGQNVKISFKKTGFLFDPEIMPARAGQLLSSPEVDVVDLAAEKCRSREATSLLSGADSAGTALVKLGRSLILNLRTTAGKQAGKKAGFLKKAGALEKVLNSSFISLQNRSKALPQLVLVCPAGSNCSKVDLEKRLQAYRMALRQVKAATVEAASVLADVTIKPALYLAKKASADTFYRKGLDKLRLLPTETFQCNDG